MRKSNLLILLAGGLIALLLSAGKLAAQQGPGMVAVDPQQMQQQMQQRMNEFFREQLGVTNDAEWKIIETRLTKVTQLRMEMLLGGGGLGAFRGMMGRGNRQGGPPGGGRGFAGFGQPSPEAEALQKAIEAHAPASELKARLEKFREARKKKQAALTAAQDDLRAVLTLEQEAVLVSMSILD